MFVGMVGDRVGDPVVGHCGSGQEEWQKLMALILSDQFVVPKRTKMAPME